MEAQILEELIEALEKRLSSLVKELLQRAFWQVHPKDEILTVLAPTLIGLAELIQDNRPLAEIKDRCLQHLRRFPTTVPAVWVVAATADDQALAALAALILNQGGHEAQLWSQPAAPAGRILLVADREPSADYLGAERLSAVGGKGMKSLKELLQTTA